MIFVIDASVAVKWFVEEENRDTARELLRDGILRFAPEIISVEVANALRKKASSGEITVSQAQTALNDLAIYLDNMVPSASILDSAFLLALDLDHPVADCLYLACARHVGAQLVTADERFAAKCQEKYAPFVRTIRELSIPVPTKGALSFAVDRQAIDVLTRLSAIYQQTKLSTGRHWFRRELVNLAEERLAQELRGLSPEQIACLTAACWLGAFEHREHNTTTLRKAWTRHLEHARATLASDPEDDLVYTISQLQNLEAGLSLLLRLEAPPESR